MWKKLIPVVLMLAAPLIAEIAISGRIVDQEDKPIANALVEVKPLNKILGQQKKSDQSGQFDFHFDLAPGTYSISATATGFQKIEREPRELENGINLLTIKLAPVPRFEINVEPEKNEISLEHIALSQSKSDSEIASSVVSHPDKLLNIVGSMTGVTTDANRKLHVDGAPNDQINWLLDGARISDPISGQIEARLSVDSLKSLELSTGRYSVDLGRGESTSKMTANIGGNEFQRQLINFVPGIEINSGLRLTGWAPHFSLAGPISRDRAWFFNATDIDYNRSFINDIKRGRNTMSVWDVSNLSKLQANLNQRNVLTLGLLINYFNAPKTGLSLISPVSTTLDKRSRRYFLNLQDLIILSPRTLVNLGYAQYVSFSREVPQGHEILELHPYGNSGNSPADISRWGSRQEITASVTKRIEEGVFSGHELKLGLDLNRSSYRQEAFRTGFEHFNLRGLPQTLTLFGGNGQFNRSNFETSAYLQDRLTRQLAGWLFSLEGGLRFDRDEIIQAGTITPRIGVALAPTRLKQTKFSFGYGLMPILSSLGLFSRKLDQYSLNTDFGSNGLPQEPPRLTVFTSQENLLRPPRISNLSAGYGQSLPGELYLQIDYLRKRGNDGFTYIPTTDIGLIPALQLVQLPPAPIGIIFYLNNSKLQIYDAAKIMFSKKFLLPFYQGRRLLVRQNEINFSYVRSRTFSNSNITPYIDDPFISTDGAGRTPWDIPNNFKLSGETQLTPATKLLYYAEWRDGTPYSAFDDYGKQIGKFNSWRMPRYGVINLHVERKFTFFGRSWSLRVGVNNLGNRANYSQVNPNFSAPGFPNYFGVEPRKIVGRIRLEK